MGLSNYNNGNFSSLIQARRNMGGWGAVAPHFFAEQRKRKS